MTFVHICLIFLVKILMMVHSPAFALFYAMFFSFILALLLLIINKVANINNTKFAAKYRTYECGFLNSNQLSHKSVRVGYFFVGILFLLFDLEILFLVPWFLNFSMLGFTGLYTGLYFLIILIMGYLYEFNCGFINWVLVSAKKTL